MASQKAQAPRRSLTHLQLSNPRLGRRPHAPHQNQIRRSPHRCPVQRYRDLAPQPPRSLDHYATGRLRTPRAPSQAAHRRCCRCETRGQTRLCRLHPHPQRNRRGRRSLPNQISDLHSSPFHKSPGTRFSSFPLLNASPPTPLLQRHVHLCLDPLVTEISPALRYSQRKHSVLKDSAVVSPSRGLAFPARFITGSSLFCVLHFSGEYVTIRQQAAFMRHAEKFIFCLLCLLTPL